MYDVNGVDFSNLQLECYNILATNKNVLKKYQEKIKYIMIDEYQDTNSIQEKIFFLLAGDRKNICVVGDDDQGLYRFRGATVKNILDFQKNFPEGQCKKIELNINYRSNEDIVKFCNNWLKTIEWNGWRYDKNMISGRIDGGNSLGVVKISYQGSDKKWQEKIYRFLSYLKSTQKIKDFNQVAFLFKSLKDKKAKYLAEYLEEKGIDIYSPRSGKFFERDEIRFVIGLFLCIFHQEKNYQKYDYYNECYEFAKKEIREDLEIRDYIVEKRKTIKKILDGKEEVELGNMLTIFYELFNFESFRKYIDISENHILKNRKTYNLGIFSSLLLKFDTLCKVKRLNSKNYKKTIENLAKVGVKVICYNFMPVFDWTRTDLFKEMADGSTALFYEKAKVEVENSDPFALIKEIADGSKGYTMPGWEPEKFEKLEKLFTAYKNVDENKLWENLKYFLEQIVPVAEINGIKMAIHPDDPPWSIFGLPRIITSGENLQKLLNLVDSPSNGITLCTGSLGSNPKNNIAEIVRKYRDRIPFTHIRNVKIFDNGDFIESSHRTCDGSLDICDIVKAFHEGEYNGYARPDHGRHIWGEYCRPGYGLYDRALGIMYIWGIWDTLEKLKKSNCK